MNTNKNPNYAFIPNSSENRIKHPVQPNSPSIAKLQELNTTEYAKYVKYIRKPQKGVNSRPETKVTYGDLIISNINEKYHFNENTSKIFSLCIIKYHETHQLHITFTLSEYKTLTHTKDSKNAKEQIINAIKSLMSITVQRSNVDSLNNRQKQLEPFLDMINLFGRGGYGRADGCKRGTGFLNLTPDFAEVLEDHTAPRVYPKILFSLRGTAYYLLLALLNNKQINYTHANNRGNRIKFKTLLIHCPNLPEWKNVRNRDYTSRIIDSLAKVTATLENLCDMKFAFLTAEGDIRKEIKSLPFENFGESQLVVTSWGTINVDQIGAGKRKNKF